MAKKRKRSRAEILALNLEEKILIERILLDKLNVIVSQNDTISTIYHRIQAELEGYKALRKELTEVIKTSQKFRAHLRRHKRARRR
jgi:hypothetical protein